ncbi:hypothetical protein NDU88_006727 [Pleurodeles waltl]|uniref:Uncharacterized protein n=1 Tax=Pleurodeles waltl TaxID=8319 RepID=A0AAV7NR22_PLEWA|nr:hypothetical protein NDU88_006727 [Pleurodeles waltl]
MLEGNEAIRQSRIDISVISNPAVITAWGRRHSVSEKGSRQTSLPLPKAMCACVAQLGYIVRLLVRFIKVNRKSGKSCLICRTRSKRDS